jgi:hypothetical protein
MRSTSALHWTFLVAMFASPGCASAQDTIGDQASDDPTLSPAITTAPLAVAQERAQTLRDDSEFRVLHNPVISADGAWMATEEHSDRGDGNVRVWSTEGDKAFNIERGQNPRISRDSRWVSALQKPPHEDSRTASPKNKRAGQTLVLLDTQDGSQRTFDFVLSHDWTYSYDGTYTSMHLVYLQSPETKADEEGPSKDEATKPAKKPAAKERKVGTLHLVHLKGDGDDRVWQNVTQYAAHQTTRHVAFVLHDEETGRDSLRIAGFSARNMGTNAIYDGEKIEGLFWARDQITLGFIDSTKTTGKDGKRRVNSALYTWQWEQREPRQKLDWGRGFRRVDTPQ